MGRYFISNSLFNAGNLDVDDALPHVATEEAAPVEMAESNLHAIESSDLGKEIDNEILSGEIAVDTFGAVNNEYQKHIENVETMEVEGVDDNVIATESIKLSAMVSEAAGVLSIPLESKYVSKVYEFGLLSIGRPTLENYKEGVLGVGDFLKKIKDKIVSFFKMIWDKIKQFWNWLFGSNKTVEDVGVSADEVVNTVDEVKKLEPEKQEKVKEKLKNDLPESLNMRDPKVMSFLKMPLQNVDFAVMMDEINKTKADATMEFEAIKNNLLEKFKNSVKTNHGEFMDNELRQAFATTIKGINALNSFGKESMEIMQNLNEELKKHSKVLGKVFKTCVKNKLRLSDLGLACKAEGVELPSREDVVYLPGYDDTVLCKFIISGNEVYAYVNNVETFVIEEVEDTANKFIELMLSGKGESVLNLKTQRNKIKSILDKFKNLSKAEMQKISSTQKDLVSFVGSLDPDMGKKTSKEIANLIKTHMVLMGNSYKELKSNHNFFHTLRRVYAQFVIETRKVEKSLKEQAA